MYILYRTVVTVTVVAGHSLPDDGMLNHRYTGTQAQSGQDRAGEKIERHRWRYGSTYLV